MSTKLTVIFAGLTVAFMGAAQFGPSLIPMEEERRTFSVHEFNGEKQKARQGLINYRILDGSIAGEGDYVCDVTNTVAEMILSTAGYGPDWYRTVRNCESPEIS